MRSGVRFGFKTGVVPALLLTLLACVPCAAQTQLQPQDSQADTPQPPLKVVTRMVTLEVVAEDSKGNHIQSLKADDFKIFEQTPSQSKEKLEQKITECREVRVAGLAPLTASNGRVIPGVFSNVIPAQSDTAPPTIILVDGLNTDVNDQLQVHVQMLRMLKQLPPNVPVAVFLLGDRLVMLQGFTRSPGLLQAALLKATSTAGKGVADVDPQYDIHAPGTMMESAAGMGDPSVSVNQPPPGSGNTSGGNSSGFSRDPNFALLVAAAQRFDQEIYSVQIDDRFLKTYNAILSIARNLAGYPGRKNLLWLSTTFPLTLDLPGGEKHGISGLDPRQVENMSRIEVLSSVLSDARISLYPINVAGVQTLNLYRAEAQPPDQTATGMAGWGHQSVDALGFQQEIMRSLAQGTGGKTCWGDNDLGVCVHRALDDSSDFYEISYYPDSPDWNGDFRTILIQPREKGAHLTYRKGYFATPAGNPDPKFQAAQLRNDCDDSLDATAIAFTAKSIPPDSPDQLKFLLSINPTVLTFTSATDGSYKLNLEVAVCTLNEKDWPLQLMNYPIKAELNEKQYAALLSGSLSESIRVPGPKPVAIRLLVKDVASGKLGSIYIKTNDFAVEDSTETHEASTVDPGAQDSTTNLPAYEVVSIKPHKGIGDSGNSLWRTTPDGFSNSDISVEKLIRGAYHLIMAEQISGLPGWASSDTFDVEAKMDEDTAAAMQKLPRDERGHRMDLMMQALLSDRFQLRVHHGTKVLPIYDLVIAKDGIRMKQAPADEFTGWSMGDGHFEGKAVPIDSFIYNLSNDVGRFVVNRTGLTGRYAITLKWTPDGEQESADSGPGIFAAIEEQLGLKLVPAKGPVDTIVVDHIEVPSPN